MAKEEKSKFQLNKGTDHGFDISKGGKRKFDLTKDYDEPTVMTTKPEPAVRIATSGITNPATVATESEEKSSKKWLLWVVAIIVIFLLAWWLWLSTTSEIVEKNTVEEVSAPNDETSDAQGEKTVPSETESSSATTPSTPTTPSTQASIPASTPSASVTMSETTTNISNNIEAEALKVIHGDYGVGQERKDKLGSQYQAIQNRVNELKREGAF